MGKKQHAKDRLYITATEWKTEHGGYKEKKQAFHRQLPFDRCNLSFTPFDTPVCTEDGYVFDILNIIPYIKKHGRNPVTGAPLQSKDLIKLHYHKNTDGKVWCPVTFKVFNENTHIVAIKTSGNVYAFEAVDTLNIKAKRWEDLVTGEKFTRADIITLQDPKRPIKNPEEFYHLKQQRAASNEPEAVSDVINTNNDAVSRILKQLPAETRMLRTDEEKAAAEAAKAAAEAAGTKRPRPTDSSSSDSATPSAAKKPTPGPAPAASGPRARYSSGAMASSFTATYIAPVTKNERALLTPAQIRDQWYAHMKKQVGKKAYVRLQTSLGNINAVIHCDLVPATAHNFLELCKKGYYNNTVFHRLIPNFMVQGGDPTGSGRGGDSAWGGPIRDEFHETLRHDGRGLLSMANSGAHTGKSQFFITFAACQHLDNKHAVFGQVVGGMETLDEIEKVPTHQKPHATPDKPKREIKLIGVEIFGNPFDEPFEAKDEEELAAEKKAKPKAPELTEDEKSVRQWFSAPQPQLVAVRSGVGKYIPQTVAADSAVAAKLDQVASSSSATPGARKLSMPAPKASLNLPPPSTPAKVSSKPA